VNSKQAKRIRKAIEDAMRHAGIPFPDCYDRKLNAHAVDSKRYKLTDPTTGEVREGKALQWRLDPNCPRGIYQRVKNRVQTARKQGRSRILQQLRDRIRDRVAIAVEHTRAAGIQQQHEAVPGLQGMGVSSTAEGEGSDQGERRVSDLSGPRENPA